MFLKNNIKKQRKKIASLLFLFCWGFSFGQVNLVTNPSFEDLYNCNPPYYVSLSKGWNCIDSTKPNSAGYNYNSCFSNMPNTGVGFQYPKTGSGFIRNLLFCTNPCSFYISRGYPKNRLKSNLTAGKIYCVKMFVNLEDVSPLAIDALQILLTDGSIDTTKYVNMPLTYLNPQITNTVGIISDTSNWIEVSGTFTASGSEKYLVIGNFKTNAITLATSASTGVGSGVFAEYFIDDVSVIDFNLAASAGPDKNIILGDSTFIGRPPEIGLECTWSSGTVTIGNGGGLWVKPPTAGTFSYVVTQNICGNIKTDTVNVNVSPGFISENELFSKSIGIYPQPAKDLVTISLNYFYDKSIEIKITDVTGKEIEKKELSVENGKTQLSINHLSDGVYILQIKNSREKTAVKRLVVAK